MRKIPPTDLAALALYLQYRPYRSALPPALPDHWLRPIARDLRVVEKALRTDSDDYPGMSGPLAIAMHVVLGRLTERGIENPVAYTEKDVIRWFSLYQSFAERELATRVIGVPIINLEDTFLAALDRQLGLPELPDNQR
jgi:hypothetical protein